MYVCMYVCMCVCMYIGMYCKYNYVRLPSYLKKNVFVTYVLSCTYVDNTHKSNSYFKVSNSYTAM
jgi:hypothetical protein